MSLKNRDQRTLEPGPYCLPVLATPSPTPCPLLRSTDTHLCLGSYMANQSHLLALTPCAHTAIVDTAEGAVTLSPLLLRTSTLGQGSIMTQSGVIEQRKEFILQMKVWCSSGLCADGPNTVKEMMVLKGGGPFIH